MGQRFTIRQRFQAFFAVEFIGVGIFLAYVALYLTHLGLPGSQVGLLLGLLPLASFLLQPLWGLLSDIYGLRRTVLSLGCLGVALSALALSFVREFHWLFVIMLLMSVMRGPIAPISAALALDHLEKEKRRDDFGGLRLWGSVGFILSSTLTGWFIVDQAIESIVILYSLTMFGLALISLTLPDAPLGPKPGWREGVTLLRRQPVLAVFLVGGLFVGMTSGIVNQYLAVYMKDIQAAGWLIGLAMGISAIPEIPLMALVPRLIMRWGLPATLIGGLAVLPLRWFLYTIIEEPLLVLPTQLLHGIGMTAILVIGVIYMDRLLLRHWRVTGQALYNATQFGIGPSLGLFAAGYLYESGGVTSIWLFSLVAGLIGVAIIAWSLQIPHLKQLAERSQP
jgi:MFS family permease